MSNVSKLCCVLSLGLLFSITSSYAQITYPAPLAQDSYVDGGNGQTNKIQGSKTTIWIEPSNPKQGLVQFDLSAIGGTVVSANLVFNVTVVDVEGHVNLHKALTLWNEGNVTFNTTPAFLPTEFVRVPITFGDVGMTVSLDITAVAQEWVNDPANNYGLALLPDGVTNIRFASKESGLGATLEVVTDGAPPPPPPPPPGDEISVSSVLVDFDTSMLLINGANFDNGTAPVVTLGALGVLFEPAPSTPATIAVDLPPGLSDGDYLLNISTGPNDGQSFDYDLTIGAVGPQGEEGAQGEIGLTGPAGTDGVDGATGPQGAQGLTGDVGADGLPGANGADGATGPVGPQGDPGVISFAIGNTRGGANALVSNTTGGANTAIGHSALFRNTTGGANTASGYLALQLNTIGNHNTASGRLALQSNTIGNQNTASGDSALFSNTAGNRNTASGYAALINNTTGDENTASGMFALGFNTAGNRNTATGLDALKNNTAGENNTAAGYRAGLNISGNDNIAIGNEGVAAESGAIRIGTEGTHSATYIAGIQTTDLATTGMPVVIDSSGQLGVGENPAEQGSALCSGTTVADRDFGNNVNVVVEAGNTCTLSGVGTRINGDLIVRGELFGNGTVTGNMIIEAGGKAEIFAMRVLGNFSSLNAEWASMGTGTEVLGNVMIQGTVSVRPSRGFNFVCASVLSGNLILRDNVGQYYVGADPRCTSGGNKIAGNAVLVDNGSVIVSDNTIYGNLICQSNTSTVKDGDDIGVVFGTDNCIVP